MPDALPYSLLPYGPNAWLVQLNHPEDFPKLLEMHQQKCETIAETAIGYDSLLLRTYKPVGEADILRLLSTNRKPISHTSSHHQIQVDYNGPDLDEVCEISGFDHADVIMLHSEALYTVRFIGFSPGFAYLDGLAPALQLPRRVVPRTQMEAGAVAIGGSHAGIYTTPSPGGWHWLGHTEHTLFNPSLNGEDAFALRPGDTLQFIPKT